MFEHLALSNTGFLFDARTGSTYSLNSTGTFLLRKLIDGAQPDDLPVLIQDSFDVDPMTSGRDASQFLFRLRDMGVIEDKEVRQ